MTPIDAFLGLGSNEDSPKRQIESALDHLRERSVEVVRRSSLYLTEPVGGPPQPWFVNAVVGVAFGGSPLELLRVCQSVEALHRRRRLVSNGPRTLDVDLLLLGGTILKSSELTLPHPRLHQRRFVLVPMVEIAPTVRHPVFGLTMKELLERAPADEDVISLLEDGRGRVSPTV
jgi:2-amino-4-hydroxy-6-hydroxymethyldihydropteridine diphosphokinase